MNDSISDKIPCDTELFIHENNSFLGIGVISSLSSLVYFVQDIFENNFNKSEFIQEINYLEEKDITQIIFTGEYISGG